MVIPQVATFYLEQQLYNFFKSNLLFVSEAEWSCISPVLQMKRQRGGGLVNRALSLPSVPRSGLQVGRMCINQHS